MKKYILVFLLLVAFQKGFSQKGLLPPRMTTAQRNAIANPAEGLLIFNTTTKCLENWNATVWTSRCGGPTFNINCGSATHYGTLMAGTTASGVSSLIPYTGGNGISHNGQTVNSTGITGLTAKLNAGNFANGNGTLIYNITGTPSGAGTAYFAINIGGKTCSLTRVVNSSSNPPPPDLTNSCSGAKIGVYRTGSSFNYSIKGTPVTAYYEQNNGFVMGLSMENCGITISNPITTGVSPTNTLRIKFSKSVANLKVRSVGDCSTDGISKMKYTFKRNGSIVYSTLTFSNIGCSNKYTSSSSAGAITVQPVSGINCNNNGKIGGIYNLGGVWFDEVYIESSNGNFWGGHPNSVDFCIGDVL